MQLHQSFWGPVWSFVWLLFVIWAAITFASDFIRFFVDHIDEAQAWSALFLLVGILYFTNPSLARLVERLFQSASSASTVHVGGRVENAFFFGRPPISIPGATARLPLTDQDRPLTAEINWIRVESHTLDAKK